MLFTQWTDWIALALLTLVLPVYHAALPWLRRKGERFAGGRRIRREIESWVRNVFETRQPILAVQQMRNITMIASALTSATLIILTLAGSFLLSGQDETSTGTFKIDALTLKFLVLFGALAIAFVYFVRCLTKIGRFTVLVGAEPETIDRGEGSAVTFLTSLFIDIARNFRDGVHFLSALFAVLFWMFDAWLCIGCTLILAAKFVLYDDFLYLTRKRKRPLRPPHLKP